MNPINKNDLLLKEYENLEFAVDEAIALLEEDYFENLEHALDRLKKALYYIDLCKKEK